MDLRGKKDLFHSISYPNSLSKHSIKSVLKIKTLKIWAFSKRSPFFKDRPISLRAVHFLLFYLNMGVFSRDVKGCERLQIMFSVMLFSRGLKKTVSGSKVQFWLVNLFSANQNRDKPRLRSKTQHVNWRLSQPFPDLVDNPPPLRM